MAGKFNIEIAEERQRQRRPDLYPERGVVEGIGVGRVKIAKSLPDRSRAYLQHAMSEVPQSYRDATLTEANRVRQELALRLAGGRYAPSFAHQGSATNGTMIRTHSDVDLLTISGHAVVFESGVPLEAGFSRYGGSVVDDLLELRAQISDALKRKFVDATVDPYPQSKAVTAKDGTLSNKFDVVPCVRFHTRAFFDTRRDVHLGISIADPKTRRSVENVPFLHNELIEHKDARSRNNFRPLVRLLKSIVADAEIAGVTSYDVAALVYDVADLQLAMATCDPIVLLNEFRKHCDVLLADASKRAALKVPVGRRDVFARAGGDGPLSLTAFQELASEVGEIVTSAAVRR